MLQADASNTDIGQFRPASLRDFEAYSKNVAWLINEPLPKAKELLCRLYGYDDEAELRKAMRVDGPSGPYDCDWWADVGEKRPRGVLPADRHNRAIKLAADCKGVSIYDLDKRSWKIGQLHLFDPPELHREAYTKLRAMLEVMDDTGAVAQRSVGDYAYVEVDESGGNDGQAQEALILFTPLGQAIYDAMSEIIPDDQSVAMRHELLPTAIAKMEHMIELHPENPWLRAGYVCSFGRYYFQSGWADNLRIRRRESQNDRGGYEQLDADRGYKKYAHSNSAMFLEHAKKAISLFSELYGELAGKAPVHNLALAGGDTFHYPAILYFGAVVAQNSGDEKLAIKWAQQNHKIVPGDNFGARYVLSTLMLNDGAGTSTIDRLFRHCWDGWAWLAKSVAAAAEGRIESSVTAFAECLTLVWAPIEVFSRRWPEARKRVGIHSNQDAPAFFQEFMHRTAGFWSRNDEVLRLFRQACSDPTLRAIVLEYHEVKGLSWGSAFKSPEERALGDARLQVLEPKVKPALMNRLREIWS